jgi:hypothetical protein
MVSAGFFLLRFIRNTDKHCVGLNVEFSNDKPDGTDSNRQAWKDQPYRI